MGIKDTAMTPNQFKIVMDRMDEIAESLETRIRKLELRVAGAAAGTGVIAFLIGANIIHIAKG